MKRAKTNTLKILSLIFLAGTLAAQVGANGEVAASPPEIQKTVDSLMGNWIFQGSVREPGGRQPVKVVMTINCEVAARGVAVACSLRGNIEGFGPVEAVSIVGYNPDEKLVHWMEISSTGEYHDHKGPWSRDKIEFEPLPYSVSGQKCTETFSLSFPSAGRMMLRSVTETPDGASTIEGSANRNDKLKAN